ncbi:hypothetical protein, partial [Geodermatophilus chilensis]|uniref:hypothetical protein n=1 Tax=Geodermatophilus chilensis TaxID=2035835 RepID=UPI0012FFE1C4
MSAAAPAGSATLAASGPPAQNLEIVVLAVLVLLAAYNVWRRRALRRRYHLGNRERAVRLQQQWIEPLVAVVLVGGVLAKDVAAGPAHLLALAVGGVIGAVLGESRSRWSQNATPLIPSIAAVIDASPPREATSSSSRKQA